MNKTKIATAALGVSSLLIATYWQKVLNDIYGRFPNYDRKIARKAFRRMLLNSFAGNYPDDLDDYTDEQMDKLFEAEYAMLTPQK
jgi:hypothetical protein